MHLPDFLQTDDDGEIRLKGHRIRLIDVAARYDEGHSPEGIVLDIYPTLSLPLVHKTIAFYLENEQEVRRLIEENAEAMRRLRTVTAAHRAEPRRAPPAYGGSPTCRGVIGHAPPSLSRATSARFRPISPPT